MWHYMIKFLYSPFSEGYETDVTVTKRGKKIRSSYSAVSNICAVSSWNRDEWIPTVTYFAVCIIHGYSYQSGNVILYDIS